MILRQIPHLRFVFFTICYLRVLIVRDELVYGDSTRVFVFASQRVLLLEASLLPKALVH